MKILFYAITLGILHGMASAAQAGPIFFTDRASFEASTPGLSIESFSTPFSSAPSLVFPDVTITESSINPLLMRWFNGTDGDGGFFFISDGPSSITFSFASPINTFGIDIVDFGTVVGSGSFTYGDNSGGVSSHLVASASLPPGNGLFFGINNPDVSFSQVTLTSTTSDESVFIDQLLFGTSMIVPEPSTLTLLGLGGLIIFGYGGKRLKPRPRIAVQQRVD